jgi:hypothetical protein
VPIAIRQDPLALKVYKELSAMYLINKYTRWYYSIIDRASNRVIDGYTERHHIIPRSLGGSNHKSNISILTAREHFICHLLLTKMVIGEQKSKMAKAAFMLTVSSNTQRRYNITNRRYEQLKLQFSVSSKGKISTKKGIKVTDPIKLANIKAAAQLRSLKYKTGELDNSKVGKYTRTETHRQILKDQLKDKPTFTTRNYKHSEETKKKIGLANTKPIS